MPLRYAATQRLPEHILPSRFFGLLFGLSVPFWVLGMLAGGQLLPGLPVSALMAVCPVLAAGILVWRASGWQALQALLLRAADFARMRPWAWLVALATMPAVMLLSAATLILLGQPLPAPQFDLIQILLLLSLFLVAATAEELGWTAYATGALVERHGMIAAGLGIGCVAVVWHVIPLLQAGRAWDWIAWWALGTMARRVLIVWLYARGGQSVFSASLFHAMNNVSWMLFPVMGSHYDPASTAVILLMLSVLPVARVGNSRSLAGDA